MTTASLPAESGIVERSSSTYTHAFVRALDGRIAPVRVNALYQLGLLLAAITMLALPVIYVSLIGLVSYGVYWHAVNDIVIFEGNGNAKGKFIAYVAPIVVGVVLVLFMIKPLFARRSNAQKPIELDRRSEPLVYAFVDRLCDYVGAPKPVRIDVDTQVNASASFRGGLGGFLRKDLVLTIGTPLAAGLTVQQFAGVLAHEFGHFAQGTGMRLTFVVRSINAWFARVVYERDEWDAKLAEASQGAGHWVLTVLLMLARFFVWMTRRILWVLMMIGHGVSTFMLRQMEFDADKYEARVAGSEAFAQTADRLAVLSLASRAAFGDLQSAWQERRLGDDLAELVQHHDAKMPDAIKGELRKLSSGRKTGWFDTHPSDAARVAGARRENAPGVVHFAEPATALFADFPAVSRHVTLAFYRDGLGLKLTDDNLVATRLLIVAGGEIEQSFKAIERYFQGLISPLRPVFFESAAPDLPDPATAAERLMTARCELIDHLPEARQTVAQFDAASKRLLTVGVARSCGFAGVAFDHKSAGVPRKDNDLRDAEQLAGTERDAAAAKLQLILASQMARLRLALDLTPATAAVAETAVAPDGPADDATGEYDLAETPTTATLGDAKVDALAALGRVSDRFQSMRMQYVYLSALLGSVKSDRPPEKLVNEVLARSARLAGELKSVSEALRGVAYPYPHADRNIGLSNFIVAAVPPKEAVGDVSSVTESALEAYATLYGRILGDLSTRGEANEAALGLDPLPNVEAAPAT